MTNEEMYEAFDFCQDFTEEEYDNYRDSVLCHYVAELHEIENNRRTKVIREADVEWVGKCVECLPDTKMFFKLVN